MKETAIKIIDVTFPFTRHGARNIYGEYLYTNEKLHIESNVSQSGELFFRSRKC